METAERIKNIPPYLFAQIDKLKAEKIAQGVDVISLGIGDPDLPTPKNIIDALNKASLDPKNHRYPTYSGLLELRSAIANWYKKRFKVELNPEDEVLGLIGSKEGIAHIFLAYINPGDYTLVSDPGYPVYKIGTLLAGGIPYPLPLRMQNNFLPDLKSISSKIIKKAKIIFVNYPHNPTSATAEIRDFQELVDFAQENELIICHDAAYSEITFDGYTAPSFLQAKGAKDVGVEFHSLSKTYNMTGWRIGWVCGNSKIISDLSVVKTNVDSGIFQALQYAGIEALRGPQDNIKMLRRVYKRRRDLVVKGLNELGWNITPPKATFYIWAEVPEGWTSTEFATYLLDKTGVIVPPGIGYGDYGEGYFRISLTISDERLKEALERMKEAKIYKK